MATYEQVLEALRNADASGNVEDAKRLAEIARSMKPEVAPQPQMEGTYVPEYDPASGAATGGTTFVPTTAPMSYAEQMKQTFSTIGRGADTAARVLADAATFGYADKLAASIGTGDYQKRLAEERAQTQAAQQAFGSALPLAQAGGAVAGALAMTPISLTARMAGAAPTLANLAKTIGAGGIEGTALGALEATGRDQDVQTGAVTGGAIGVAVPTALGALGRAVSPLRSAITSAQQKAVDIAAARNIPLSPGQTLQMRPLRYIESQLENLSGIGETAAQQRAINREVAASFGAQADEITPDIIDKSFERLGNQFDTFTQNKTINTGAAFKNEVKQIRNEYENNISANVKPILVNQAKGLLNLTPQTSGEQLQKIRSTLARLERDNRKDPELNLALTRLRESVDDAIERSLPPAEAQGLRDARRQYRNLNIVSQSLGTGEVAQAGNVSLKNIANVLSNRDRVGYARGRGGELEELSRVGGLLANPPSSGTSERVFYTSLLAGLGALGGQEVGGQSIGDVPSTLIGGVAAPIAAALAYKNPVTRAYLLNQAAAPLERAIPSFARYGTMGGLLATEPPKQ